MRFAVLGPLSVSLHGGAVSLGGRKQRTLLAVLLLDRNRAVSRDLLIDALWGERPPASATPLAGNPGSVTASGGSVWVADP